MCCRNQWNVNQHWQLSRGRRAEENLEEGCAPPGISAPLIKGTFRPLAHLHSLTQRHNLSLSSRWHSSSSHVLPHSQAHSAPETSIRKELGLICSMENSLLQFHVLSWAIPNPKTLKTNKQKKTFWDLMQTHIATRPGLKWHEAICSLYPTWSKLSSSIIDSCSRSCCQYYII